MNFDRKGGQVESAAHAGLARSRWVYLFIYFFTVAGLADLALRPRHCPRSVASPFFSFSALCLSPHYLFLFYRARNHDTVNLNSKGGQVEGATPIP